jgi:hypothetical protein
LHLRHHVVLRHPKKHRDKHHRYPNDLCHRSPFWRGALELDGRRGRT